MVKGSELPSIKALRTFMAVASTMNFSKAADELAISQGAVSKQIATLERQLGQPLFHRHINGIELTNAGKRYLPKVSEALQIIQSSTANVLQSDKERDLLTINVTPSFASLWLIEKIEEFTKLYPHIQISIKTGDGPVKNSNSDHDVFIRCLPLSQHYEHARLLQKEILLLVASPSLMKKNPIRKQEDLARHDFIPQVTRPQLWEQFKSELKLDSEPDYRKVGYEHFFMSLTAVMDNRGLALLPDFMVKPMQKKGQLVNPLQMSMTSLFGYYVIVPSYKRGLRKVYDFENWLNSELGENDA
ncbi:LysR substrate-binding domain-containing protein [Vibrio hannami]|uniref:LysR substrate-binding domain-containing protein n=1 Tax=Vibrio hannami TaxID=2717094 RepID=UPI00240F1C28|nr:LysR substrate-binding domain-containing protein [Vibrio hannami]MDG3084943.1 LysR substrate-binding domain-containing protein [Vibrio hannami]